MTYEELSRALRIREEELKTLRVELEKNSKELDVYKKALGLACKHWSDLEEAVEECGIEIKYHIYSPLPRDRKVEVYLNKARKQSDEANVLLQPGEE